jgi:hypothetical protein
VDGGGKPCVLGGRGGGAGFAGGLTNHGEIYMRQMKKKKIKKAKKTKKNRKNRKKAEVGDTKTGKILA